jgi:hypothetical protein
MLKSYLLTAFRNLLRNRVFAFINISGLSIGISAALVIFLIVQYEFSFDTFHPDAASIYRVVVNEEHAGEIHSGPGIPLPLIDAVKKEVTGIRSIVPMILCDDKMEMRSANGSRGPVGRALEQGDQFSGGIGGPYIVDAGFIPEINLFRLDKKKIPGPGWTGETDRDIERNGDIAMRIAGEGKGRIGGRKKDTAVYLLESIDHLVGHPVM